jgi:hypothetical protein
MNRRKLEKIMNPGPNAAGNELYVAAALRFFTNILWYFNGDYSINNSQGLQQGSSSGTINNSKGNGKGSIDNSVAASGSLLFPPPPIRKDYFDWFSVEHEYWSASTLITDLGYPNTPQLLNTGYTDHKDLFNQLKNLLSQNQGCHIEIETYENLMEDNQYSVLGTDTFYLNKTIQDQADELKGLPDRILFVKYTGWPNNIVDRYCYQVNAWGAATTGQFTEMWSLLSAESTNISTAPYCPSPTSPSNWGNFLGDWFDPYSGKNPTIWPAYPYELDEMEDGYIDQFNYAVANNLTDLSDPDCRCCSIATPPLSINVGNFTPEGFMWFFLGLLNDQNVVKRVEVGLSIEYDKNEFEDIYPNPAKHIVNLPTYTKIEIRTLEGKVVEPSLISENKLSVEKLSKGIYIIGFWTDSDSAPKIVKLVVD